MEIDGKPLDEVILKLGMNIYLAENNYSLIMDHPDWLDHTKGHQIGLPDFLEAKAIDCSPRRTARLARNCWAKSNG